LVRNGRVLLAHRSPSRLVYPDVWDFPGGHVERGESPPAAVVRELREELGVAVSESALGESWRLVNAGFDLHAFLVAEWLGEPRNAAPHEHDAIGWFTVIDACALELADPRYRAIIEAVLADGA
jgi:8-oxo-dGTP diphosphatase